MVKINILIINALFSKTTAMPVEDRGLQPSMVYEWSAIITIGLEDHLEKKSFDAISSS